MHYLLLIYHSEADWAKMADVDREPIYREYRQLREQLSGTGKYIAGSQLMPTGMATTVRVRDGKRVVTDGPFAETKEQLGGYFFIDASGLDEAIAVAGRIPAAREGSIEIRPLVFMQRANQA